MRKVTICISILFSLLGLAIGSKVFSLSETVVISTIQVRDAVSSTNESVTLTNTTSGVIDITGWCLQYASGSAAVASQDLLAWHGLACFTSTDEVTHIMLPPHQSASAVSTESGWAADLTFSATLANSSGHVRLVNKSGNEIDKVGWGDARYPETQSVAAPSVGYMLQRHTDIETGDFVDTDNNFTDFVAITENKPYSYGLLFEMPDICRNIEGFQPELPGGYIVDITGNCYLDVDLCPNLGGWQYTLPGEYALDEFGNCAVDSCNNIDDVQLEVPVSKVQTPDNQCVDIDVCLNVSGAQSEIPSGYKLIGDVCYVDLPELEISEVLPNALGTDNGREFIELYNPNDQVISLANYVLYFGNNYEHSLTFASEVTIGARSYLAIYNSEYNFSLLNTTTHLKIATFDGMTIDNMPMYQDPKEDMAWANINKTWQYTNRPTPGKANVASFIATVPVVATSSNLKPCAANQYRNTATNRCRLIETQSANLTPCKEGQVRSPATNRCRSEASASVLSACKEGQERNPETNRCRNATSDTIPKADYDVASQKGDGSGALSYIIVTVIIVALLGGSYAVWEWRHEISRFFKRIKALLRFRR